MAEHHNQHHSPSSRRRRRTARTPRTDHPANGRPRRGIDLHQRVKSDYQTECGAAGRGRTGKNSGIPFFLSVSLMSIHRTPGWHTRSESASVHISSFRLRLVRCGQGRRGEGAYRVSRGCCPCATYRRILRPPRAARASYRISNERRRTEEDVRRGSAPRGSSLQSSTRWASDTPSRCSRSSPHPPWRWGTRPRSGSSLPAAINNAPCSLTGSGRRTGMIIVLREAMHLQIILVRRHLLVPR